MPNLNTYQELLNFAQGHAPIWAANATDIGLTTVQTGLYTTQTAAANAAFDTVANAKRALAAAVIAQREAFSTLRTTNGSYLRTIRAFAIESKDPSSVYIAAQIAAPKPPAPMAPPVAPDVLNANLDLLLGGVKLTWKATQPKGSTGVVFRVERSIGASQNWQQVGLTGEKRFTDSTIPAGTSRVQFRVIAQRGSAVSGSSPVLDIRFGTGPGEMSVSTIKLAA